MLKTKGDSLYQHEGPGASFSGSLGTCDTLTPNYTKDYSVSSRRLVLQSQVEALRAALTGKAYPLPAKPTHCGQSLPIAGKAYPLWKQTRTEVPDDHTPVRAGDGQLGCGLRTTHSGSVTL